MADAGLVVDEEESGNDALGILAARAFCTGHDVSEQRLHCLALRKVTIRKKSLGLPTKHAAPGVKHHKQSLAEVLSRVPINMYDKRQHVLAFSLLYNMLAIFIQIPQHRASLILAVLPM